MALLDERPRQPPCVIAGCRFGCDLYIFYLSSFDLRLVTTAAHLTLLSLLLTRSLRLGLPSYLALGKRSRSRLQSTGGQQFPSNVETPAPTNAAHFTVPFTVPIYFTFVF